MNTATCTKKISLLGLLGWILPLAAALATGATIHAAQPGEDARRASRARDELRAINAALIAPRSDGKPMPDTAAGLASLVEDEILPHLPPDPWGRPYQYRHPGKLRSYELFSLGSDGRESADDVVAWNLYGGR